MCVTECVYSTIVVPAPEGVRLRMGDLLKLLSQEIELREDYQANELQKQG